jgi:hypothetical protein
LALALTHDACHNCSRFNAIPEWHKDPQGKLVDLGEAAKGAQPIKGHAIREICPKVGDGRKRAAI